MTQDSQSDAQASEASKTPDMPKDSAPDPATPKTGRRSGGRKPRGRLWLWLTIIVLSGLLVGGGYGGWYLWQEQQQHLDTLQTDVAQLEQEVQNRSAEPEQLRRELEQHLNQRLAEQREQQEQALTAVAAMEERLESTNRRLRAMSNTNREDWKLAEAEYLLRLANQRLLMERDGGNALAMAQQADQILRDINDTELFPVRRALARNIAALKLADQVDREGIYLELMALAEQLDQLPLVEPLRRADQGEDTAEAEAQAEGQTGPGPDASRWQRVKHRVGQSFRRLRDMLSEHLRIRRHDEPVEALMPVSDQFYLRQNLSLMLEQAQTALLREQADIFRVNLNRAADWVEEYYTLNPQTRAVQEQLRALADTPISQTLPDLGQALSLLQDHIDRMHRLSPPETENDGPENNGRGDGGSERENNA